MSSSQTMSYLLPINGNTGAWKQLDANIDNMCSVLVYPAAAANMRVAQGDNDATSIAAQGNDFIMNGLNVHPPMLLNPARTWVRANGASATSFTYLITR